MDFIAFLMKFLTYTRQRRNIGSTQINYKYKVAMPCWRCSSDVAHAFPMLLPVTSYFSSMPLLFRCETMWFISVSSTHHLCVIHAPSIQRLHIVYASSMYYRGISAMHPLSMYQLGIAFASSMHLLCIIHVSCRGRMCFM